jgi:hypothetical protein
LWTKGTPPAPRNPARLQRRFLAGRIARDRTAANDALIGDFDVIRDYRELLVDLKTRFERGLPIETSRRAGRVLAEIDDSIVKHRSPDARGNPRRSSWLLLEVATGDHRRFRTYFVAESSRGNHLVPVTKDTGCDNAPIGAPERGD